MLKELHNYACQSESAALPRMNRRSFTSMRLNLVDLSDASAHSKVDCHKLQQLLELLLIDSHLLPQDSHGIVQIVCLRKGTVTSGS